MREFLQQFVADGMAETVVHELEPVDVEEHHGRQMSAARGPREGARHGFDEQQAVRQPGERVVQRLMAQLLLCRAAGDRVGEHVRDGVEEVEFLGGQRARWARLDFEGAEGGSRTADHDLRAGAPRARRVPGRQAFECAHER